MYFDSILFSYLRFLPLLLSNKISAIILAFNKKYLNNFLTFYFWALFKAISATIHASVIVAALQCSFPVSRMRLINYNYLLNPRFTCCFTCSSKRTLAPLGCFYYSFDSGVAYLFFFNISVSNFASSISEANSKITHARGLPATPQLA